MRVLLSIKPEFVDKIFAGEKCFEYRKRIFKKDVESVVIYATMPVGKVLGEFKVEEILYKEIEKLWTETSLYAGIEYKYFEEYFKGVDNGYALKIKDVKRYKNPIELNDIRENLKAPQSFCYIDNK